MDSSSLTQRSYKERILRVLVHIQQHLDEALCLEGLTRIACFSPSHFHRIFGAVVGESLMVPRYLPQLASEYETGRPGDGYLRAGGGTLT